MKEWTPIEPVVKQYPAGFKGEANIQRYQFPLGPAHAKTIHRSQGDTLEQAVMDLSMKNKVDHMYYVAISRLKSIDGLYVRNLEESKISVSDHVKKEMARLRSCSLSPSLQFLDVIHNKFKLIFLNARSMKRHMHDISEDPNIRSANIACFCETRFSIIESEQQTQLNFFNQYTQDGINTSANQRSPYGIAIYSKTSFVQNPQNESLTNKLEISIFSVCDKDLVGWLFCV